MNFPLIFILLLILNNWHEYEKFESDVSIIEKIQRDLINNCQ
jgi:hypothetical protein